MTSACPLKRRMSITWQMGEGDSGSSSFESAGKLENLASYNKRRSAGPSEPPL